MRTLPISLILLFASVALVAQDQSSGQASGSGHSPLFQRSESSLTRDLSTLKLDARIFYPAIGIDPRLYEQWRAGNAPCYTMRSYLFERRDDFAPELVGMTTCTSARDFQLKRTKKPGRGFVPLIWSGGNTQK